MAMRVPMTQSDGAIVSPSRTRWPRTVTACLSMLDTGPITSLNTSIRSVTRRSLSSRRGDRTRHLADRQRRGAAFLAIDPDSDVARIADARLVDVDAAEATDRADEANAATRARIRLARDARAANAAIGGLLFLGAGRHRGGACNASKQGKEVSARDSAGHVPSSPGLPFARDGAALAAVSLGSSSTTSSA